MATIKLKRGAGVPSSLAAGEPAMDTATGRVYISKDGSNIIEVGSAAASSNITGNLTVGGTAAITGTLTSGSATVASLTSSGAVSGTNATFSGTINGVDPATWTAGYNDKINSASFASGTGVLSLVQQDTGSVTVDLDGRYPEVAQGSFTPEFTDGTNVASATTAIGKYFTLSLNGTAYVSYVTIAFSAINTTGLISGANVVIKGLPAAGVVAGTDNVGYEQITSFWQNIAGIPAGGQVGTQYGGNVGHFKVKIWEATGQATANVSNFDSSSVFILHAIMQG
jgi:hypothetical protein